MVKLQLLVKYPWIGALMKSLCVRVHSAIATHNAWTRLWYVCRAFDLEGSGRVRLPAETVRQILKVSKSNLYQWLREGKRAGAFRHYSIKAQELHVVMGGLQKLAAALKLDDWNAVAAVPLHQILQLLDLRATATAVTTQRCQQRSRTAARRSLNKRERKFYQIPTADEILEEGRRHSLKPEKGSIPCLLWVGRKLIFVSRSFIPFGTSQQTIAAKVRRSDRTVRRHQARLNIEKRQLCQTKKSYRYVLGGMQYGVGVPDSEPGIYYLADGHQRGTLYEPNGNTRSKRAGGHQVHMGRFFLYRGECWIRRCNLYGSLNYSLCSMKATHKQYKILMAQGGSQEASVVSEKSMKKGFSETRPRRGKHRR